MIKPYTVITLNVPESGQGLELAKRKEKKTVCALDHSAEVKTFRRNVRTNSKLWYHQLNSSSCLQTIIYRKFCKQFILKNNVLNRPM